MRTLLASVAAGVLVSGCGGSSTTPSFDGSQSDRIARLERDFADLKNDVDRLDRHSDSSSIELKATDHDFGYLKGDFGTLAVKIIKVDAEANGSRVAFDFGNLSSATISKLTIGVAWAPVDEQGNRVSSQARSDVRNISTTLLPGTWNPVSMSLADIPPTRLGTVTLSGPQAQAIKLYTPIRSPQVE